MSFKNVLPVLHIQKCANPFSLPMVTLGGQACGREWEHTNSMWGNYAETGIRTTLLGYKGDIGLAHTGFQNGRRKYSMPGEMLVGADLLSWSRHRLEDESWGGVMCVTSRNLVFCGYI